MFGKSIHKLLSVIIGIMMAIIVGLFTSLICAIFSILYSCWSVKMASTLDFIIVAIALLFAVCFVLFLMFAVIYNYFKKGE